MNESLIYKLNIVNKEEPDKDILQELHTEVNYNENKKHVDKEVPQLLRLPNGKYKFSDGTREYNSPELANNAIGGFRKFQDKREETTQLIHKKSYNELERDMNEAQRKQYNRSVSGKNIE